MSGLRTTILMATMGALALVLVAITPQRLSAQQADEEVSVKGVVVDFSEVHGVVSPEPRTCGGIPCPEYGLTDEDSGVRYGLLSKEDLSGYLGERISLTGTVEVGAAVGGPALVDVASVERAGSTSGSGASGTRGGDLLRGEYAGEEPAGRPIVYNLIPAEGAIVVRDQLGRAGATIETQRHAGVARAAIFVDGQRRPSALMGPTSFYQSISADIGGLEPGLHTVRVIAIDAEGRAGGYAWTFTVV